MAILTTYEFLLIAMSLIVIYPIVLTIYRLYLHPLAKFPGPKVAAATLWYEFYWDVIQRGRYTFKIIELHAQYGPIIRISPHELHIDDPDYYDELYVGYSVRRTEKYKWSIQGFGDDPFIIGTIDHDLHRNRRAAIAPSFAKAVVQKFEPSVQLMVDKLTHRLDALKSTDMILNIQKVFACLTTDIVCQYAFAAPFGYLDSADFSPYWPKAVIDASEGTHFLKQFIWVQTFMNKLPQSLVARLMPNLGALFTLQTMIREKVAMVKEELEAGRKIQGQRTIFYELFTNEALPPEERTPRRLEAEGVSLVAAGSMTVAHTLSTIAFYLLADPKLLERLQDELASAIPDSHFRPTWAQLEKLPYLKAVIQEGLRVGCGVSHRLQRIAPDVDLRYRDFIIPKGTPVGMTSILQHHDPRIFPNPDTFHPERWLHEDGKHLAKYLVPFSKGSRNCVGMNLAYAELYLTIAAVFQRGRYNLALFETSVEDVIVYHDFFNASTNSASKGIRIKFG